MNGDRRNGVKAKPTPAKAAVKPFLATTYLYEPARPSDDNNETLFK